MKQNINSKRTIHMLVLMMIAAIYSCKKEATLPEAGTFATVRFNDPFGVFDAQGGFAIAYQGMPIAFNIDRSITVLPGEGEFEFSNLSTGTKVLTKKLNISKDTVKTYAFFKPDPDAQRVELIENNQLSEPRPAEDHIKVRMANFAQSILGDKDMKIVFSQNDIPVDTIQTTGSEFTNGYTEMNCAFTIIRGGRKNRTRYSITFLDENNNTVLDANGAPILCDVGMPVNYDINLFTFFAIVYNYVGQAPQIVIATLFED